MDEELTTFIRKSINEQKSLIKEITDVSNFVLNKQVSEAIKEIKTLQSKCPHQFQNKQCIFCDKMEK